MSKLIESKLKKDFKTISSSQLEEMALTFANNSIESLGDELSLSYYETKDNLIKAYKECFYSFASTRYVVLPSEMPTKTLRNTF